MTAKPANCHCQLPLTFRHLPLLLLLTLSFSNSQAQYVTIPDSTFADFLSLYFPGCVNGNQMDTTCPGIVNATSLDCSGNGIANMQGIQYFDNLKTLDCSWNNPVVVPSLPSGLLKLDMYRCFGDTWPDTSSVPPLPAGLKFLNVGSNPYLYALPPLPAGLDTLICSTTGINSLPSLPPGLVFLACHENFIYDMPSFPSTLKYLACGFPHWLGHFNYTTFPPLPAGLTYFYSADGVMPQQFTSLPAGLTFFSCDYCGLTSLPALPDSLRYLFLLENQLTSLPALPSSLHRLDCNKNQLASLPALPSSLNNMDCSSNQLTSMPALPSSLDTLICNKNQLTSLPALPSSLIWLNCGENQLTSLPALPPSLSTLSCPQNQLAFLPALPSSLRQLNCNNNQLTTLPPLPLSIQGLNIANNPITCLPPLPSMNNFTFSNTQLTCLPNYPSLAYSNPALNTLPLCDLLNNPNGCDLNWNISGKTYFDQDSNCTFNIADTGVNNIHVKLWNHGNLVQQMVNGGGSGVFSFNTNLDTFQVGIDTAGLPFQLLCPANNVHTSILTLSDSLDHHADFALKCRPGFDFEARSIATGRFRPGRLASANISAGDVTQFYGAQCVAGLSGTVTITITGPVTYESPAAGARTPTSVNNNILTYTIADMGSIDMFHDFNIILRTDTAAQSGQQVCVTVSLTPTAGDRNASNNTLSRCFSIVNSYDPNDKQVFPTGNIDTLQEWLTYTIRFQNTGTAEAIDIHIDDTLDTHLDASTFQLLAYSHAPVVQLHENSVRFNFPNINLPDSTSDEPGSHGYVLYKVKLKPNLSLNTQVENTAYIYFDFNPPVITNTTVNTIAAGCTPPVAVVTPTGNTICAGESITFTASGGTTYAWSDGLGNVDAVTVAPELASIYTVTVTDANGCTASATASVNVKQTGSLILNQSLCSGDSMFFNNAFVKTAGTYPDTVVTSFGCDSFVTLILDFTNVLTSSLPAAICSGESYQFGGTTYTAAGFYPDTLVSASGCDSIVTLGLTVHPLPQPVITQTDDTLSVGNFASYVWLLDGNLLPYQTFQQVRVTQNGNYSVMVTDANGCTNTSAIKTVVGVGVGGLANDDLRMTIYPNPNNGKFTMEFGDARERAIVITDLMGKVMLTTIQTERTATFNLNGHASGVYFVRVMTEGKAKNLRLVIVD